MTTLAYGFTYAPSTPDRAALRAAALALMPDAMTASAIAKRKGEAEYPYPPKSLHQMVLALPVVSFRSVPEPTQRLVSGSRRITVWGAMYGYTVTIDDSAHSVFCSENAPTVAEAYRGAEDAYRDIMVRWYGYVELAEALDRLSGVQPAAAPTEQRGEEN